MDVHLFEWNKFDEIKAKKQMNNDVSVLVARFCEQNLYESVSTEKHFILDVVNIDCVQDLLS